MGLTVNIKGYKGAYDCGYVMFYVFRKRLAYAANAEYGALYEKWCDRGLTQEECDRANAIMEEMNKPGLDIFLTHSDCDGSFSVKECRMIYEDIKDMTLDMVGHNYGTMEQYNMLDRWKDMFQYCFKNRRKMFFE